MLADLEKLLLEFQQRNFTIEQMYEILGDLGDVQYTRKRARELHDEGNHHQAMRYEALQADFYEQAQKRLDDAGLDYKVNDLIL